MEIKAEEMYLYYPSDLPCFGRLHEVTVDCTRHKDRCTFSANSAEINTDLFENQCFSEDSLVLYNDDVPVLVVTQLAVEYENTGLNEETFMTQKVIGQGTLL